MREQIRVLSFCVYAQADSNVAGFLCGLVCIEIKADNGVHVLLHMQRDLQQQKTFLYFIVL